MKSKYLMSSTLLFLASVAGAQTLFRWPVQQMPSYAEATNFYVTNNYVDQNQGAGVQDYNCGTRTYNGHLGIDIDLWPFTWSMMDANHVGVVAAAAGRVVAVDVGQNNESNCGAAGENTNWNYIAIRHADSSTSIYGHLRNNSATVRIGDFVTEGQLIAFVGSSGSSSNPHLHFEVNRNAVNNSTGTGNYTGVIDPYAGSCNTLNTASWWQAQKPYREPAILRVMTHFAQPRLAGFNSNNDFCRSGETKNGRANFAPGDSIYFGVAMRDFIQSASHSFSLTVFRPDGTEWFTQAQNANFNDASRRAYYTIGRRLPTNAASGNYRAAVTFNGGTTHYFFSVNCVSTQTVTGNLSGVFGYKASSTVTSTAVAGLGSQVLLQAGTRVTLSPGFRAVNGSVLKARIRDCNFVE